MSDSAFIEVLRRIVFGLVSKREGVAELMKLGEDKWGAREIVGMEYGSGGDVVDRDSQDEPKAIAPILRRRFLGKLTDAGAICALGRAGYSEPKAREILKRQDALIAEGRKGRK